MEAVCVREPVFPRARSPTMHAPPRCQPHVIQAISRSSFLLCVICHGRNPLNWTMMTVTFSRTIFSTPPPRLHYVRLASVTTPPLWADRYVQCKVHGALFRLEDGACAGGMCKKRGTKRPIFKLLCLFSCPGVLILGRWTATTPDLHKRFTDP